MTVFRNIKLNLCILQIIVNKYIKFHDNWSDSLKEDSNNKVHQTGV